MVTRGTAFQAVRVLQLIGQKIKGQKIKVADGLEGRPTVIVTLGPDA